MKPASLIFSLDMGEYDCWHVVFTCNTCLEIYCRYDSCVVILRCDEDMSFLLCLPSCWSFLGQTGGSQTLSLQTPGCMWSGVAAHEFMHALGFVHEQSRSDRDHYVSIVWKNIIPGEDEWSPPNVMLLRVSPYFTKCVVCPLSFMFWQNKCITSGNR